MDNASFRHSDTIESLCAEAGVKLLYLPPYLPDLNPIEDFFAELKAFVKRDRQHLQIFPSKILEYSWRDV